MTSFWCFCFIFEYIWHVVCVSIVDFELVNDGRNTKNETQTLQKAALPNSKFIYVFQSRI